MNEVLVATKAVSDSRAHPIFTIIEYGKEKLLWDT
jgi:hypothetical protein